MTKSFPLRQVNVAGGFWEKRKQTLKQTTVKSIYKRFLETGRFAALQLDRRALCGRKPHHFWDSDCYKWLEGVAYLLQQDPDNPWRAPAEELIGAVERSAWEDGYVNSYFTLQEPENRFQNRDMHELYTIGHLIEAAVAWAECTGSQQLLNTALAAVKNIHKVFLEDASAGFQTPGHEEIELALLRLYEYTKNPDHLDLALFFLNRRGQKKEEVTATRNPLCNQSHLPVRQQKTAEGHAVRAMYLYCAMADAARLTEDRELADACNALFQDIVQRKLYLTGGIGSSAEGEAFTMAYDLPSDTAYAETCASIGLFLFAWRMLKLSPEAAYGDVMEQALYNGILSGISLDGNEFFYENPLEMVPALRQRHRSSFHPKEHFAQTRRQTVFSCSCCPPNLFRLLTSIESFLYTQDENFLYCHHYMDSVARFSINEEEVTLRQNTQYPWNGTVCFTADRNILLQLRIPAWCRTAFPEVKNGYLLVTLKKDTPFSITFPMTPRLIYGNSHIRATAGKAALQRGPLVYCLEQADNGKELWNLNLHTEHFREDWDKTLDCPVLLGTGQRTCYQDSLYSSQPPQKESVLLKWIPYYAFANREEGEMAVWIRT